MAVALRRVWDLRYYVPLAPLGALLLTVALGVHLWYAPTRADVILYAASLFAVGLVALAVVSVMLTALVLWRRIDGEREPAGLLELESGARSSTGLSYPRYRFLPLVEVEVRWVDPADVEVGRERLAGRYVEVVRPRRRGRSTRLVRRLIVRDIFSLTRVGLLLTRKRSVRIRPARLSGSGQVIAHIIGGDALSHPSGPPEGELLDMRRYADGDPMRHVLWKAFARTRQLLVRTPERAIAPSPSGIAYFVAGPEDESTASAARYFIEEGLLGDDFLFGADGAAAPTGDADQALDQLIASAEHVARGGEDLSRFLDAVDAKRRASCVLFVPARAAAWLDHVERAASRIPKATVVIGIGGAADQGTSTALRRLLTYGVASADSRALLSGLKRLRRAGFALRVVHSPSGRVLAPAQLEALAR